MAERRRGNQPQIVVRHVEAPVQQSVNLRRQHERLPSTGTRSVAHEALDEVRRLRHVRMGRQHEPSREVGQVACDRHLTHDCLKLNDRFTIGDRLD